MPRARRQSKGDVVYHALNGIRVIAMDFWPGLTVYYRPLVYGVVTATVIIFAVLLWFQ